MIRVRTVVTGGRLLGVGHKIGQRFHGLPSFDIVALTGESGAAVPAGRESGPSLRGPAPSPGGQLADRRITPPLAQATTAVFPCGTIESIMDAWPIRRTWSVLRDGPSAEFGTAGLRDLRACAMLGAAGLGKTYEIDQLAELDREEGRSVRSARLALVGQSADALMSGLTSLAEGATSDTVLSLDALDEVMIPVPTIGPIIAKWIRTALADIRPVLRISCRSAVWPSSIETALTEIYRGLPWAVAVLQPLTEEDIRATAAAAGLDASAFAAALEGAGAEVLAESPLVLEVLLRLYREHAAIPVGRSRIFADGVALLAKERGQRIEDGTTAGVSPAEVLEVAERLACYTLLSGRENVDLGDGPPLAALGEVELSGLPGSGPPLAAPLLRAVGRSGLFEGAGPLRFRFWHRQFAEYLAGRRLAKLPLHQSRALLASGLGPEAGIAGPLRETAAFAAMHSQDVAAWVTDRDPEVVGLSDIADDALRRRAALNLLEKFRRNELTDVQIHREGIKLDGFLYAAAEADLRPVLRERGEAATDLLECAVSFVLSWKLASMSDDLADLMLDDSAPLQARKAAGYALLSMGTTDSKRRLRALISDRPDDPERNLKGLALRCNWPDGLTVPDLLESIATRGPENYTGAYEVFLWQLDREGFGAHGHTLHGLTWALDVVQRNNLGEPHQRLVRRIAAAAVAQLGHPGVAHALADLLLAAAETHDRSPLAPRRSLSGIGAEETNAPDLAGLSQDRRLLLDALAERGDDSTELEWAVRQTPGLVVLADFPWLLSRATDADRPLQRRERYAHIAEAIPWRDHAEAVEAWLAVRTAEPIASVLGSRVAVDLDGPDAARGRKNIERMRRWRGSERPSMPPPDPVPLVARALELSETKDPRYFIDLARVLTLDGERDEWHFERFLTATPGWAAADAATRGRIVEAAKRLLLADSDEPERIRSVELNSIQSGLMSAVFLVLEVDAGWLKHQSGAWWKRWAWYLLRELRPGLSDEPGGPKEVLFRDLHARAAAEVREAAVELALSPDEHGHGLLRSLLEMLRPLPDRAADEQLRDLLVEGRVPDVLVGDVAGFLLRRDATGAGELCGELLDPAAVERSDTGSVHAAAAMLRVRTSDSWEQVAAFLDRRRDLAPRVLATFLHDDHFDAEDEAFDGHGLRCAQAGQLAGLLLEFFLPESDPASRGFRYVGPENSAREARDRLISWLGDQKSAEAVSALRELEQRFGRRAPWLRRPRARAERAYRLHLWAPVPVSTVARVLADADSRVIRSEADAVDGLVAAVERYAYRLRHGSPSDLDDLWNLPKGRPPTPREEERVSDKIAVAVRDYLGDYAVSADREVQVYRRQMAESLGGAPGSEVDLLFRRPAAGLRACDALAVPIEVKLAHNPEARTGLAGQLVGRYMSQLGASGGVYVVVWMGPSGTAGAKRPLWNSPDEARAELMKEAERLEAGNESLRLGVVVIDASLPRRAKLGSKTRTRGAGTKKKPKPPSKAAKKPPRRTKTNATSPKAAKSGTKRKASAKSGTPKEAKHRSRRPKPRT